MIEFLMAASFHLHCSTNVLLLDFDIGWEQQTHMTKLAQAILKSCQQFEQQPWAIIDDIRRWPIKSPKDIALCTELSQTLKEQGMTHFAICINDIAVSKWMMKKIVPSGVKQAFFSEQEQCKNWLAQLGFDTQFDPHNMNKNPG